MSLAVEPRRLGGRTGRHARVAGLLFDPAPWLILAALSLWLVRMFHQAHCEQQKADQPLKTMLRMCYSDIPIVWNANQWGAGAPILSDATAIPQTPVVSLLVALGHVVTGLVTPISATPTPQQQLEAGNVFMVVNAVVLFCLFLTWVVAHMLMGADSMVGHPRDASGRLLSGPSRSRDAFYLATSLGVLSTGLINWDLVAPALTAVALLAWASGRPLLAGVVTGVALGAGLTPVALVFALLVLCARAGRLDALGRYLSATVVSLVLVIVLASTQSASAVRRAYLALLDPDPGLGSLWWILQEAGVASQLVPGFSKLLIAVALAGVGLLALRAPHRPRVAQVGALVMIAGLMFAPTYSPQYVLWLVGWVALARPRLRDWIIFSATELVYWAAVWGHLQGNLRIGGGEDSGYPLAIVLRVAGQGWIAYQIISDMMEPWRDPVRSALVDDPQGGVLDGAPDAEWMRVPPGRATPSDEPEVPAPLRARPEAADRAQSPAARRQL